MLSTSSAQLLAEKVYAEDGEVHTAEEAGSATKRGILTGVPRTTTPARSPAPSRRAKRRKAGK
jgi:hypothetical protein